MKDCKGPIYRRYNLMKISYSFHTPLSFNSFFKQFHRPLTERLYLLQYYPPRHFSTFKWCCISRQPAWQVIFISNNFRIHIHVTIYTYDVSELFQFRQWRKWSCTGEENAIVMSINHEEEFFFFFFIKIVKRQSSLSPIAENGRRKS